MSLIKIRAAQTSDLEALNDFMYELHDFHHKVTPELFKTAEDVEQEKSIARYLDNPECFVYVAVHPEHGAVGFISGHFCELQSSIMKPVQMGSIDEMYVEPGFRKQGIARLLFLRLERSFKDCGVKQMFVEVWQFNEAALNFYSNLGLEHHIHWMRKPLIDS
ncbi:GNAT family N-acetyltransferase [Vibrio penaeicida]|uniref:N-acetyltransferase n=1 Tax=Vibrio penaeicida TaxID=104609 RepID=A0AAV5NX13_9VIBR|nr:GNAT family N-acetyltransferase [Vibrio penaeicida]RTZ21960.1 GNAT family N-acetyltransferase [Vibrio penaeicida]GLQ74849.1 N-acetyltransferase [Vibrio penaeicida]